MIAVPRPSDVTDATSVLFLALPSLGRIWPDFGLPDLREAATLQTTAAAVVDRYRPRYGALPQDMVPTFLGALPVDLRAETKAWVTALVECWSVAVTYPHMLWADHLRSLGRNERLGRRIDPDLALRAADRYETTVAAQWPALQRLLQIEIAALPVSDWELALHAEHRIYYAHTDDLAPPPIYDTLRIVLDQWHAAAFVGEMADKISPADEAVLYDDLRDTLRARYEDQLAWDKTHGRDRRLPDRSRTLPPLKESVRWL